jgi:hypothetical protein
MLHHDGQLEVRTLVKCMLKWVHYWQQNESLRTAEATVEERSVRVTVNSMHTVKDLIYMHATWGKTPRAWATI